MNGPLEGIRVVDLGLFIAGPCAGHVLAGLGAEVIKVEPKGGDPFRHFGDSDYSPQFQAYNAGKQSVVLDYLKSPADRDNLLELVATADVLIENFRPGVMAELNLGWEHCRAVNDRLIYCSISGFGQTGPKAAAPCFDTIGQAASGFLGQMLDPAEPRLSGPAIADAVTGHYAAEAVLAALVKRSTTGSGASIDVAMLDCMIHFNSEPFATYLATGSAPAFRDRVRMSQSFVLRCADGALLAIHLSSKQKFWDRLIEVTGDLEAAQDPRFSSRQARIEHFDALEARLQGRFLQLPLDTWLERLERAEIPCAAVASLSMVEADAQVASRGVLHEAKGTQGTVRMISSPWRFDGKPPLRLSPPPSLGEHADIQPGHQATS